ncbi:MAG: DegT/DnrJ/EryC1/StrS family aminotransferase [Nanoarchaeota archaeon]
MDWKIPLFKINWTPEDVSKVDAVIRRGTFWAAGPEIIKLEAALALFTGRKHALVFNSGTSALHAALLAYGVKGHEVIVPTFTFISGVNTIVLAGGKPVFAESENETYGLDAADVEKRVTPNTKAIVPIHYGGKVSRDIEKLRILCDKHKLILIEDAAESIGAMLNGKQTGSFGHATMFSFCQNKIVTSGEGGAIVTDDDKIYNKMKLLRSHGRLELSEDYFATTKDNDYLELGYNDRMSSLTAALALSQLSRIDAIIAKRQAVAEKISTGLRKIKEITLPTTSPTATHVFQMYTIRLPDRTIRDGLQKHLEEKRIQTKVYFNPVHLKTYYKREFGGHPGQLPFTEKLSGQVLYLPIYENMTDEEITYMTDAIKEFFKK